MNGIDGIARADARMIRNARIALVLFAAWYIGRPVRNPFDYVLLRDVVLAVHEAGHMLFMPFGEFMMVLGGTLFQVTLPLVFVGYFALKRDFYAACFLLFWEALSLTDAALYIGDARERQLPLLSGDPTSHDWTWLLIQLNALQHDRSIASAVRAIGVLAYIAALGGSLYFAWHLGRPALEPNAAAANKARADRGSVVVASSWREEE